MRQVFSSRLGQQGRNLHWSFRARPYVKPQTIKTVSQGLNLAPWPGLIVLNFARTAALFLLVAPSSFVHAQPTAAVEGEVMDQSVETQWTSQLRYGREE